VLRQGASRSANASSRSDASNRPRSAQKQGLAKPNRAPPSAKEHTIDVLKGDIAEDDDRL
jgi:hypothetical protein